MNFFGIGLPEMVLILVVALLIFGPKKLPEIGRTVGKALKGFQEASNDFQAEFKREADLLEQVKAIPNNIMNPMISPVSAPLVAESLVTGQPDSEQLASNIVEINNEVGDSATESEAQVDLGSGDRETPIAQQL